MNKFIQLLILIGLTSCSSPISDNIDSKYGLQPDIRPIPSKTSHRDSTTFNYRSYREWNYYFTIDSVRYKGTVPRAIISDGTSIPKPLWSITGIQRDGLERAAAWAHDWHYQRNGKIPLKKWVLVKGWTDCDKVLTREESDNIFYNMMKASKVSEKRARLMFDAVRKYGYIAWNKHLDSK